MFVWAEIKAVPDLNLESDIKLEKLESFLGKLNSKGTTCMQLKIQHINKKNRSNFINCTLFCLSSVPGLPEATITVTEKKVKEVMTLEDETFSKFYRHVEELPANSNKVELDDDFDAIFDPEVPK